MVGLPFCIGINRMGILDAFREASAASGVNVVLTHSEMVSAAMVGILRQCSSVKAKAVHRNGPVRDPWQCHVEGALAEMAFAKAINRHWSHGVNAHSEADVGETEVRYRSNPDWELILRAHDKDDATFVLVTGGNGEYKIVGSITGREGKDAKWWKDPTGGGRSHAYFVPQSALKPWT